MTALPQMVTPPGAASSHRRDPVGPAVNGDLPPPCPQGLGARPPAGGTELRERPLPQERVAKPHLCGRTPEATLPADDLAILAKWPASEVSLSGARPGVGAWRPFASRCGSSSKMMSRVSHTRLLRRGR